MAKKSKKTEDEAKKVVAKCDTPNEVVTNCDHLQSLKFRPTLPYAFTEQGIGQLSTVVHGQTIAQASAGADFCHRVRLGRMDLRVRFGEKRQGAYYPDWILGLLK